jgi:MoCo/4Fe-4S cofactor protein with predicted Tat translocation signal
MGNKVYWKGPEELHQTPELFEAQQNEFPAEMTVDQFLGDDRLKETSTGRRDFLKFLGFSLTAATLASCETPVIKSIPYVNKPEDITPGVATWYASSYYDGNDFGSVLVKTREGRPIHIKGNPLSNLTKGTVNSRINSSVLSLYDSTRLSGPMGAAEGEMAWHDVDGKIKAGLEAVGTGEVAVLSSTIISPSTKSAIEHFATKYAGGVMDGNDGAVNDTIPNNGAPDNEAHSHGEMEPGPGTFRHVSYDAVSNNGITEANSKTFGKRVVPAYDFSKAKVIVSIGADFCANWLLSTQYIKDYGMTRRPSGDWMSRHFQFESTMSITGANADVRRAIKPSQAGLVAAGILDGLNAGTGVNTESLGDNVKTAITTVVAELKANNGQCLVVSGSNNVGVQMMVNQINSILGNYGSTIDIDNHVNLKQGDDAAVEKLIADMNAGNISALIVYGANPAWNLANAKGFKEGLAVMKGNGQLTVSTSMHNDETGSLCDYICPDHHYLESWNDLEPAVGNYALVQPTITKLYDTRQAQESFLAWGGMDYAFDDVIKMYWEHKVYPGAGYAGDFTSFWNEALHNGGFQKAKLTASNPGLDLRMGGAADMVKAAVAAAEGAEYEIVLYTKAGIGDGAQSGNPWLHELPDPISKVTWDNYLSMSPADIRTLGLTNATLGIVSDAVYVIGQEWHATLATVVVNEVEMTLPIFPQPGQAVGTIGIALGYGREGGPTNVGRASYQYGRYGENIEDENGGHVAVGKNAFPLVSMVGGTASYIASTSSFKMLEGQTYEMACTQTHHTLMGRTSVVRETTTKEYAGGSDDAKEDYNPTHAIAFHENGQDHAVQKPVDEIDLWDAHPVEKVGHRWGMSIDLSTCLGCGSCITACNSENNVPVVGKDEVRRVREMHWLRLDRYYSSDEDQEYNKVKETHDGSFDYSLMEIASDQPKVVFMPMMCQHCNHAPCETVCPVAATTHSNEGLNQMTYNRCIGTRYCANNCPFKVRRFNWFNYNGYKKFTEVNPAQDDVGRMVLNPDVVVRSRGVMEKCSLCVQQIQAGKLQAKKDSRPVNDGEIQTACASACPTHAITFGDLNDTHSKVAANADDNRAYRALEEVGVQPNVYYMTKVRNTTTEA